MHSSHTCDTGARRRPPFVAGRAPSNEKPLAHFPTGGGMIVFWCTSDRHGHLGATDPGGRAHAAIGSRPFRAAFRAQSRRHRRLLAHRQHSPFGCECRLHTEDRLSPAPTTLTGLRPTHRSADRHPHPHRPLDQCHRLAGEAWKSLPLPQLVRGEVPPVLRLSPFAVSGRSQHRRNKL